MTGVIIAVIRKREGQARGWGYGFIRDEAGQERFFHANNLRDVSFGDLREGQKVEFTPVSGTGGKQNGLRAECVRESR